jgi:hypothetical protein
VAWRNEMVAREDEEERKGEDGVVRVTRVLLPRLSIVPSEEMDPDIAAAIAQISQGPNGEVRVRLHDKHAALVSIGKHQAGKFLGWLIGAGITPHIPVWKKCAMTRARLALGLSPDDLVRCFAMIPTGIGPHHTTWKISL